MFNKFRFVDNIFGGYVGTYVLYLYAHVCIVFIPCDLSMTPKHDKPLLGALDQVLELGSAIFNHVRVAIHHCHEINRLRC